MVFIFQLFYVHKASDWSGELVKKFNNLKKKKAFPTQRIVRKEFYFLYPYVHYVR